MARVHFITHPEVVIDPAVPVPDWPLSDIGFARMRQAMRRPWMSGVTSLFCSAERKATDAAGVIASAFGLVPVIEMQLGENDRSATGYLPRVAFEALADCFFAQPQDSVQGWERAADAQARIVAAVEALLAQTSCQGDAAITALGDTAIVAHGGVGALLLCHLLGVPISRALDQPGDGGGHFFTFDRITRTVAAPWRRIET